MWETSAGSFTACKLPRAASGCPGISALEVLWAQEGAALLPMEGTCSLPEPFAGSISTGKGKSCRSRAAKQPATATNPPGTAAWCSNSRGCVGPGCRARKRAHGAVRAPLYAQPVPLGKRMEYAFSLQHTSCPKSAWGTHCQGGVNALALRACPNANKPSSPVL